MPLTVALSCVIFFSLDPNASSSTSIDLLRDFLAYSAGFSKVAFLNIIAQLYDSRQKKIQCTFCHYLLQAKEEKNTIKQGNRKTRSMMNLKSCAQKCDGGSPFLTKSKKYVRPCLTWCACIYRRKKYYVQTFQNVKKDIEVRIVHHAFYYE